MTRLAVPAALVLLLLGSAASAAEPPDYRLMRELLGDAKEHEQRAVVLLAKKPPRVRAADLRLQQSREALDRLAKTPGFDTLGPSGGDALRDIRDYERYARGWVDEPEPNAEAMTSWIRKALYVKSTLDEALRAAATGVAPPECADGKDNDGDGSVDARVDAGCSAAGDATESSSLSCRLAARATPASLDVTGACSGPVGRFQVTILPPGFVPGAEPEVEGAKRCTLTATALRCTVADGAENPLHRIGARLPLAGRLAGRPTVTFATAAGRALPWVSRGGAAAPLGGSAARPPAVDPVRADPETAGCGAALESVSPVRVTLRCRGVDVKTSSVWASGVPVRFDGTGGGEAARFLVKSGLVPGGTSAVRAFWRSGNRGKALSMVVSPTEKFARVTLHVLAGGHGDEGTTIVLRQDYIVLADGTQRCTQGVPRASECTRP